MTFCIICFLILKFLILQDAIKARLKKHMFQKYEEEMVDGDEMENMKENEIEEDIADDDENSMEEQEDFEVHQTENDEVYGE